MVNSNGNVKLHALKIDTLPGNVARPANETVGSLGGIIVINEKIKAIYALMENDLEAAKILSANNKEKPVFQKIGFDPAGVGAHDDPLQKRIYIQ